MMNADTAHTPTSMNGSPDPNEPAPELNDRPVAATEKIPVPTVVAGGLGMGIAGDHLLRTEAGPGLGFFLLFTGLAAAYAVVAQRKGAKPSREAVTWIFVGLCFGAMLLWRGSGLVRLGTFVAACTAFALPALHAGRSWIRSAGVLDIVEAVAGAAVHAGLGSVLLIDRRRWMASDSDGIAGRRRKARTVLRSAVGGVVLAAIPLVVFGALFMSADPVFATMVSDIVQIDLEALASHIAVIALLSWLATGYLVGTALGTRAEAVRPMVPGRPRLGIAQVGTAIGLVDLLFLAFVVVQAGALFGGAAWVQTTPGLTYAEYARSGFFQLLVAVALAIPWLLTTHALIDEGSARARSVFRALGGLNVALLLAIVASAMQRMHAYQSAYGLTEDRIIATAVLVALTLVVLWFSATVLSGRRERFALGGLVTAYALVASLQVIDPAGWAARHSLDRITSDARADRSPSIDGVYLASLGSDAVPYLATEIGALPATARCEVAARLVRRWGPDRATDWRSFNWAEEKARLAVADGLSRLQALAGEGCQER